MFFNIILYFTVTERDDKKYFVDVQICLMNNRSIDFRKFIISVKYLNLLQNFQCLYTDIAQGVMFYFSAKSSVN